MGGGAGGGTPGGAAGQSPQAAADRADAGGQQVWFRALHWRASHLFAVCKQLAQGMLQVHSKCQLTSRACLPWWPPCCRRRLADAAVRSAHERAQDEMVVREGLHRAALEEAREAEAKARRKADAISYR